MKTLRKQVGAGLFLALLVATLMFAAPAPVQAEATSGAGNLHCITCCCFSISGFCIWPGCKCCEWVQASTLVVKDK